MRIFSCLLALLLITQPIYSFAEDFKIATVDLDRILNESKVAQTKKKELDAISSKKKQQIDAKRTTLKATEDKIKKGQIAEDSKEADQFRAQARDFTRMVKDAEDELRKEYLKTTRDLMKRAAVVIEQYAKSNKMSLVLEKSKKSGGPVLYGSDTMDITSAVITEINKG